MKWRHISERPSGGLEHIVRYWDYWDMRGFLDNWKMKISNRAMKRFSDGSKIFSVLMLLQQR